MDKRVVFALNKHVRTDRTDTGANLYISKTVEGVCLYIDFFPPILRFLSVSYKTKTIQVVFSFGFCLSVYNTNE